MLVLGVETSCDETGLALYEAREPDSSLQNSGAGRLLALTGLTPDDLRAGLGDPGVLGAVLDFLASHEPDLISAADHLGVAPQALIAARHAL